MIIQAKSSFIDIRAAQGYSITSLARKMHVSPSTVFSIEQGKSIHPKTAQKACETLGLPFADLFIINGKPVPNKQHPTTITYSKEETKDDQSKLLPGL